MSDHQQRPAPWTSVKQRLGGIRSLWSDSSLRTRMIALTTLAFALVLGAVAVISTQALEASARQALDERQILALLMAERVESQLVAAQHGLRDAITDERLDLEDGDLEPERPWLDELHMSSSLCKTILLLDASGQVLLAAPATASVAGKNMSDPPYNVRLPVEAAPVILPAVGSQSGMPGLRIIQPIRSPLGGTVGYLLGWFDVGDPKALSLLYPYAPGKGTYTDLVDDTGRVLLSSEPARVGLMTDHAGHFATLVRTRSASTGTCHDCHDQGTSRGNDLLAFAPLKTLPWGVAVRQPEAQVFAATQNLTRDLAALALAIIVIFTGLVSVSARSLAQPLERLTRACRQIASGDLTHPVRMGGVAETKALASSFETMRQDLLAYRTATEYARQGLESRVQERTAELQQVRDHLVHTNRNLTVLNAVAAILGQSLDVSETLGLALGRAVEALGADRGVIYARDAGGALFLAAHHGLSDQQVRQVRRQPEAGRLGEVDAGLAAALQAPALVCAPLEAKGANLGRICIGSAGPRPLSADDQELLASIAAQMALAVRNAGLYDALQREEAARAELLHKVIVAQEDERKRVARELHDETSQAITALMLGLDTAGLALERSPQEATERLAATRAVADGMLQNIHRLISDLRPALLDDLGLVPAISWYAEQRLHPLGVAFHMECAGIDRRLPPHLETAVFRIVQEAVTNVVRHAAATNFRLTLAQSGSSLLLKVRDDGKGIDNGERAAAGPGGGAGLRGMRERVNLLEGEFELESAPGLGTTITVRLPLNGLDAQGPEPRNGPGDDEGRPEA